MWLAGVGAGFALFDRIERDLPARSKELAKMAPSFACFLPTAPLQSTEKIWEKILGENLKITRKARRLRSRVPAFGRLGLPPYPLASLL